MTGIVAGQFHGQRPLLRGEPGGADDHRLVVQAADLQVLQGDLRGGEVDQDVAALDQLIQIIGDGHAEGAAAGNQPGIHAEHTDAPAAPVRRTARNSGLP